MEGFAIRNQGRDTTIEPAYLARKPKRVAPTPSGDSSVEYNTTAGWNSNPSFITNEGVIYIYTDRKIDGKVVPGIKIGNGAPLIDLAFIDQDYAEHILDQVRHITQEEREYWNNKSLVDINAADETMIITK